MKLINIVAMQMQIKFHIPFSKSRGTGLSGRQSLLITAKANEKVESLEEAIAGETGEFDIEAAFHNDLAKDLFRFTPPKVSKGVFDG